jgi:hypothetical protein
MLQMSHVNVSKLNIIFSMLRTLIFDVGRVSMLQTHVVGLQTLNFNFADVEFLMLQAWDVGFVLRRRGGKLMMSDVACNTGRNMGGKKDS